MYQIRFIHDERVDVLENIIAVQLQMTQKQLRSGNHNVAVLVQIPFLPFIHSHLTTCCSTSLMYNDTTLIALLQ